MTTVFFARPLIISSLRPDVDGDDIAATLLTIYDAPTTNISYGGMCWKYLRTLLGDDIAVWSEIRP